MRPLRLYDDEVGARPHYTPQSSSPLPFPALGHYCISAWVSWSSFSLSTNDFMKMSRNHIRNICLGMLRLSAFAFPAKDLWLDGLRNRIP